MKTRLGNAIKRERATLGISQEELAARAGLHRTYVSDVERGARNPSLESVQKLAEALEVSLPVLFERSAGRRDSSVEILLVEDNPHDVRLTMHAFKKARLTNPIHVVADGEEALEFLFATGRYASRKDVPLPEVMLLDLNLPKKSGLEVLRQIKADPWTQNISVVVLTVSNQSRDVSECRRLGATHYIVKPVEFQNFSEITPRLNLGWSLIKPREQRAA
ncbi:MAG TPA: helix-turn-helix domain-containing protein [Chthoniobacterales bacterium]|nr:helix-turn-helix domain-containing protein [Chthoniobacterales bacterium]